MFYMDLHVSADGEKLEGTGKIADGTTYSIIGTIKANEEGRDVLVMVLTYKDQSWSLIFRADLCNWDKSETVAGVCGYGSADDAVGPSIQTPFILSRLSPEILIHRPSPSEFEENRAKALWQFAISAVRDQVRRQLWSWSYFKARREMRKLYIELDTRVHNYGRLLEENEVAVLVRCRKALSPADARFYHSIREYQLRTANIHE